MGRIKRNSLRVLALVVLEMVMLSGFVPGAFVSPSVHAEPIDKTRRSLAAAAPRQSDFPDSYHALSLSGAPRLAVLKDEFATARWVSPSGCVRLLPADIKASAQVMTGTSGQGTITVISARSHSSVSSLTKWIKNCHRYTELNAVAPKRITPNYIAKMRGAEIKVTLRRFPPAPIGEGRSVAYKRTIDIGISAKTVVTVLVSFQNGRVIYTIYRSLKSPTKAGLAALDSVHTAIVLRAFGKLS